MLVFGERVFREDRTALRCGPGASRPTDVHTLARVERTRALKAANEELRKEIARRQCLEEDLRHQPHFQRLD